MKDINYSDEQGFDAILQQISDCYENSKMAITRLQFTTSKEEGFSDGDIAFRNMQQLRGIACQLLKRVHSVNEN